MAKRRDVILMYHPETGRRIRALDDKQAAVFERSGWKRGTPPTKEAAANRATPKNVKRG